MANFAEKIQEKEKYHAYIQGAKASAAGLVISDCAYEVGTKEYIEWLDGFLDDKYLRNM